MTKIKFIVQKPEIEELNPSADSAQCAPHLPTQWRDGRLSWPWRKKTRTADNHNLLKNLLRDSDLARVDLFDNGLGSFAIDGAADGAGGS